MRRAIRVCSGTAAWLRCRWPIPATPPTAQIHSNADAAAFQEFALKPGRITVARFSQARKNETKLVIAGGEMISAPKSFTGTSGVFRFDCPARDVTTAMMDMALEHHVAIVYGDVRDPLRALGAWPRASTSWNSGLKGRALSQVERELIRSLSNRRQNPRAR